MAESGSILRQHMFSGRAVNERIARMGQNRSLSWGGNPIAEREWRPKISSFSGAIEGSKTADLAYMTKVANDALKHFGFKGDAEMVITRDHPGYTDYALVVGGDKEVSAYRQYGNPREPRTIGANLEGMVEDAILYKISKKSGSNIADALTDAVGHIRGMRWKWNW